MLATIRIRSWALRARRTWGLCALAACLTFIDCRVAVEAHVRRTDVAGLAVARESADVRSASTIEDLRGPSPKQDITPTAQAGLEGSIEFRVLRRDLLMPTKHEDFCVVHSF
jgi:hypothetical protein